MSSSPYRKNKPYSVQKRARNRKIAIIAVVAIIIIAVAAVVAYSQGYFTPAIGPSPSPSPAPVYISNAAPLTGPAGEYSANGTRVLFITSMGNITLQMRDDKPITTGNFVNLVNRGVYDNILFHRVIAGFMIQSGQNTSATVAEINDEIGNDNHNVVGTIAMAKTSLPNSATSEFFINVGYNNSTSFDSTYTVFGQVIGGMDVVMNISNVQVQANPQMQNENSQPVYPVKLLTAVVLH